MTPAIVRAKTAHRWIHIVDSPTVTIEVPGGQLGLSLKLMNVEWTLHALWLTYRVRKCKT